MHCPNCGQQTSADLKFCRSCGMKLTSVAQALDEHLMPDPAGGPPAEIEKKSPDRPRSNAFFRRMIIAAAFIFIGVAIGVAGEGTWGMKTLAVLISLLGFFIMAFSLLPMAARYDRELLSKIGSKADNKPGSRPEKIESAQQPGLPGGDQFEPATLATPVPSVTENTTRKLVKNKGKH